LNQTCIFTIFAANPYKNRAFLIVSEVLHSKSEEMNYRVWTVDAFTSKPFYGNPAGVIILDNQEFPSDDTCLQIAAEINLSETAFVKSIGDKFHIRWFTPKVEVELCGHATLASAHVLFEQGIVKGDDIEFESLSGILRVKRNITDRKITLDFPLQITGPAFEFGDSLELLDQLLGKKIVSAVATYDDIIIELEDEFQVRNLNVSPSEFAKIPCRGVIITGKGIDRYDFVSRFFAPSCGILEDPVTGSAHCKLAHYWMKKLQKMNFLAYQASQRGGELEIQVSNDQTRVFLTGNAITVLKGQFMI
jgi:PhzF family phenazine biosynthesis protein